MRLKIKSLNFEAGRPVAILNERTALKINAHVDDRIILRKNHHEVIAVLDVAKSFLGEKGIAVSREVLDELEARQGNFVDVELSLMPQSVSFIHKKLECAPLSKDELHKIIYDIVRNALTESEIAYFVSAVYKCGMSMKETIYLIEAIVKTGRQLKLRGKVADKHSIGGIAGNRTTPIVVAICASAGLIFPKTSSRAITSAAGTADVIETIARVEFSISELQRIIKKTGACLAWGGALGLAPADDKIIQVERLLNIDPEPQLLASILSKKIVVDSKYVLIDIPYGKGAKVSRREALELKKKFEVLAKKFKMKLKCVLTDGSQPVGNGIGPVLEIADVLSVLKQESSRPLDLEKKSLFLSGLLLEMTDKSRKGGGFQAAASILKSGKALEKFSEIIKAQHGSLRIPKLGKFSFDIKSEKSGRVSQIDNKKINFLARVLGCPADKGAGVYLFRHLRERVKKSEILMRFYAESPDKLRHALKFYKGVKPVRMN